MKTATVSCLLATVASVLAQGKKYTIESNGIKAQVRRKPQTSSLTDADLLTRSTSLFLTVLL